MNLNKAIVLGRVAQDPEARTTPSGQQVCNFTIVTNRIWSQNGQKQQAAEFHNIVLWRRLAEIASQYLKKGGLVLVEGRIQTRSWQDKTGMKRYRTEIIGESMQLGPKVLGEQPTPQTKEEEIPIIEEKEDGEINVEDIPF
ncbi:MAG: single-stranded DNA-binding protein [Candidatus Nealsonbacteria bacterium RIFOXYB1_FULL_40_15]|uniref:Single-stranded DNA-binding protein n=2 Tax=Candidatus Nealsoniibacteriota TaxID=1817911 RepID=A0A1G2EQH3_9BACT|nr:MAG: single-stranded DNA-binding protein [Candidatus Nealsonbacteria bacterium RIFOXYB1_FULL_40_15]OGZ28007.1 MAG: single-stranded DNA-binding protein [Candidatus Nealsonbacteria bacterium RIFOXYC1_FULL_40_7]OGZ28200.1 MAG: single-stranded DNA-binding protein [Candidatus Nealsonbacteria bacterium RIFOXYD1_FULL_39_11]